MPPLISQSSLSSLARCKSCAGPIAVRSFTTSSRLSKIFPESPKFIEIPTPPQRDAAPPRDIKGTLPAPRNIFPTRGPKKTEPEYLAAVTQEPIAHHHLSKPQNEYIAWKRRMAEWRRTNLREGIIELHDRKVRQDKRLARRSELKRKERDQRFNAPIREDERLTNPTITAAMSKLQMGVLPDPDREARLVEKAEKAKAKEAMREEARREALHTLYMHARSFITTEQQLDAEIEKIFVESPFGQVHEGKTNIWDALGAPPTVQDMLSTINNTQRSAVAFHAGPADLTGKRIKKIAEELTGGKMD
ncbi:hypothetical protein F5884DRAFT_218779 [Xylogone sp. PMI_703]|nr:hypothetical protein F5884DRAFT_218779 [Xylogone sp. PMI_703]